MFKALKMKASLVIIGVMLVLGACSGGNNDVKEVVATPTPAVEGKAETAPEVIEEVSLPVSYLTQALENAQKAETLSYNATVSDTYYMYSTDTGMLANSYDYTLSMSGDIRRNPADAHIYEYYTSYFNEFDENGNATPDESYSESQTYIVGGDSVYVNSVGYEETYKFPVSGAFKTVEHLEDIVNLFLLYPDKLVMHEDFGAGFDTETATINYELTNEQFVKHILEFKQSFFAGHYDINDVDIPVPNVDTVDAISINITINKDFNVQDFYITYMDKNQFDATSSPDDYLYYGLSVFFNSTNGEFFGELPAEIRDAAIILEAG